MIRIMSLPWLACRQKGNNGFPKSVVVSATASSADGVWPYVDFDYGKPAYWFDEDINNYLYWSEGANKWYVDVYAAEGEYHGHNDSTSDRPPKTGWVKDSGTLPDFQLDY